MADDPGEPRDPEGERTETLPPSPASGPLRGKPPAVARFAPGAVLASRYRIVSPLGRGGMGEVYRAEDLRLGETVALKFLPAEVAADRAQLERLVAEVRLGRRISHPNVCRIHDLVEAEGHAFLAMEYVDGEDLASLLTRIGRLPAAKALELARDLCAGLAAVHEQGVVHRDLKPANIMVDGKGRGRITDFGVAAPAAELRGRRGLAGTLAYMAPEQLAGGEVSVHSDLYALGLVLYEMLSGRRPFSAETMGELQAQQQSPPRRLSETVSEVDPEVERVVLRCLAPTAEERPASARQVLASLPGGDPLAAAVAAGETPSPELVAAAPEAGLLSPLAGWLCFLLFLSGLVAMAAVADRTKLHRQIDLPKPPEALVDRAVEILSAAGYDAPVADRASEFFYAEEAPPRYREAAELVPPALRFFLRASPQRLDPWRARFGRLYLVGYSELGLVTADDPPLGVPGEAEVVLDPAGRLVELRWVPEQEAPEGAAPLPAEAWRPLLAATGIAELAPAAPSRTPPLFATERLAWWGRHPAGRPVRLEAGALAGRPVWLRVFAEAEAAGSQEGEVSAAPRGEVRAATLVALLGIVTFLVGGVALVHRNLRLGRGDRQGAFRLAMACFLFLTAAGLLRVDHQADVEAELLLVGTLLSQTVFCAFLAWLVYMAVEPYVRRRWPLTLVSWTRLLSGRRRDPMVGRDVLVGLLVGLAVGSASPLSLLLESALGAPRPPFEATASSAHALVWNTVAPSSLSELRHTFYYLLYLPYPALLNALGFLLFLVLLRAALRRTPLAVAVLWLLLFVPLKAGAPLLSLATAGAAGAAALLAFTLLRFGLLANAVALAVMFLSSSVPFTLDGSAWYFGRSLALLLLLAALGTGAFVVGVGGRLGVREELLEG